MEAKELDHFVADHPGGSELWHCKARAIPSGDVCPVRELCKHFAATSFNWIYDRYAPEPMNEAGCRYFLPIALPDRTDDYKAVVEAMGGRGRGRPSKKDK